MGIFLEQWKYGWEALLADWYLLTERCFRQDNDMVGYTIQHSRDPHSQNIFIIIQWVVEGISLSLVRNILPIIPYLNIFLSSPRLGLIYLNHSCGKSINSSSRFLFDVINLSIEPVFDEFYHQRNTPFRSFPSGLSDFFSNTWKFLFKP